MWKCLMSAAMASKHKMVSNRPALSNLQITSCWAMVSISPVLVYKFCIRGTYMYSWDLHVEILPCSAPYVKRQRFTGYLFAFESYQAAAANRSRKSTYVLACSCTCLHMKVTFASLLWWFHNCRHMYLLVNFCDGLSQEWCVEWSLGV